MAKTGDMIYKYRLGEHIGSGGFARVFQATDTVLEREAAVKVLHEQYAKDSHARQRFLVEAQTASGLSHPLIVRIYDLIDHDTVAAIAMEYMPAGDLYRWLERHQDTPPTRKLILNILRQTAEALDYLHSQELVHRDVKPSNILLSADPTKREEFQIRLSDFGLVTLIDSRGVTQDNRLTGSAPYVSPEQAEQAEDLPVDHRSDQYSLAVVAYELLVGRPPFVGNNATAVIIKRLDELPPLPSQSSDREVPPEIDSVLMQALAREPGRRYASCLQFVKALEDALQTSDQRRYIELRQEARQWIREDNFDLARQCLERAARLWPSGKDLQIDVLYLEGTEAWKLALQKAQIVLDYNPHMPDPQHVFVTLGLRQPARRLPTWQEFTDGLSKDQIVAGILLSLLGMIVLLYLAFAWLVRAGQ